MMTKKNPLQSEAGSSNLRADESGIPTRKTLTLHWSEKTVPVVCVSRNGPFFHVLIDPPIPENHPNRRPQTFASLATAEREAAIIARIIGGKVMSNAGHHG